MSQLCAACFASPQRIRCNVAGCANRIPPREPPPSYAGLDDRESLNEWHFDSFHNESDFLGFDPGDQ